VHSVGDKNGERVGQRKGARGGARADHVRASCGWERFGHVTDLLAEATWDDFLASSKSCATAHMQKRALLCEFVMVSLNASFGLLLVN
jgi:hypothetical protein